jgi:ABC-2 type transport system permease protein
VNESKTSTARTLRQLYLTLFLRGRSSRGLNKAQVPKSVGAKLWGTLALYALVGLVALTFLGQPSFILSFYLHGMSLLFLGMFIAASAGEILFNKDEAEILLHRPVAPRVLLWAKVTVLTRISLWLACAFNLTGLIMGSVGRHGSWLFLPVHLASTCLAALFCSGSVVLLYQLCLRWFGRERLDNLMTGAQVLLAVGLMAASQLVPHVMRVMGPATDSLSGKWWLFLLPPAWFAGFDEVFTGRAAGFSWALAGIGVAVTATVLALAFGRMAGSYEEGLQNLAESRPAKPREPGKRRLLDRLIDAPPLSWILRDPVVRASFLLTAAYLSRDRDVKLRLYPGLAPVLVMPAVFLIQGASKDGGDFGIAFAGGYLGLIPLMAMNLLQYSQNWQAADLYRLAPVPGPGPFIHGAIRAVAALLVVPGLIAMGIVVCLLPNGPQNAAMLLPGLIAMPVYALAPGALEKTVPLSKPAEEAKSAMRGAVMFVLMISALAIPGLAMVAKQFDGFRVFLIVEALLAAAACLAMGSAISRKAWDPLE